MSGRMQPLAQCDGVGRRLSLTTLHGTQSFGDRMSKQSTMLDIGYKEFLFLLIVLLFRSPSS